jgi:hypothetical protein
VVRVRVCVCVRVRVLVRACVCVCVCVVSCAAPGVPPLLLVSGTLPISYKGAQYNIPIQLTIPEGTPPYTLTWSSLPRRLPNRCLVVVCRLIVCRVCCAVRAVCRVLCRIVLRVVLHQDIRIRHQSVK